MILFVDLIIVAIIAFCAWRGYSNGLVRGAFGFVSIIVALLIANIIASAYSHEFTGAIEPFIGGIVDSTLTDIVDENIDLNFERLPGLVLDVQELAETDFGAAFTTLRQIGLPEAPSVRVAEMAATATAGEPTSFLAEAITEKLSSTLAFIAVFGIAFILLAIIGAVVGNLVGIVFALPGMKLLDCISGAVLGFAKGLLIVYSVAFITRYFGLFAHSTFEGTAVLKFLSNYNPIAGILGV